MDSTSSKTIIQYGFCTKHEQQKDFNGYGWPTIKRHYQFYSPIDQFDTFKNSDTLHEFRDSSTECKRLRRNDYLVKVANSVVFFGENCIMEELNRYCEANINEPGTNEIPSYTVPRFKNWHEVTHYIGNRDWKGIPTWERDKKEQVFNEMNNIAAKKGIDAQQWNTLRSLYDDRNTCCHGNANIADAERMIQDADNTKYENEKQNFEMPKSRLKKTRKFGKVEALWQYRLRAPTCVRQCQEQLFLNSQAEEDRIVVLSSHDSPHHSHYPLRHNRMSVTSYRELSAGRCPKITTADVEIHERHQARSQKRQHDSHIQRLEKQSVCTKITEHQVSALSDPMAQNEIMRKLSTCLSFYGNFVIIPAIEETLESIKKADPDARLNYWHEIMAFVDSYDLPYATEQRKKQVDELVENITNYIEQEGICAENWQSILCKIPDDTNSKFDYRIEYATIKEMEMLVEKGRLPFDLNASFVCLLESAKKHAGEYIRNSTH